MARDKNKQLTWESIEITEEQKRNAALVLSGTSITLGVTPVELRTVLSALNLYEKTSSE